MKHHANYIAHRTQSLRRQAADLHPVVAQAFHRRADELATELELWTIGALVRR